MSILPEDTLTMSGKRTHAICLMLLGLLGIGMLFFVREGTRAATLPQERVAAAPTPTPGPTPPPPGPGCSDVIINGDFEGSGGWITYSALGTPLISSFPPASGAYHSGRQGAYMADYNNARDFIAQQVNIPSNATYAVLQYWWQVETQESRTRAYDDLNVFVDRPLGNAVEALKTITNLDAAPVWRVDAHNLLRYRGRTITVRWEARTDANRPTAFYIDDVSFIICVDVTLAKRFFLPALVR